MSTSVKQHAYIGNLQVGAVFMCGSAKRMIKNQGLHGGILPVKEFIKLDTTNQCLDCLAKIKSLQK